MNDIDVRDRAEQRNLPQDTAAEQSVLGSLLLSHDAIAEVIERLTVDDFYEPKHAVVYATIVDLYAQWAPVDPVTVANQLSMSGDLGRVGGHPYLHTLIAEPPTPASVGHYAQIVAERAILRRLAIAGTRITQAAHQGLGDPSDLVDHAQEQVYALTSGGHDDETVTAQALLPSTLEEIDAIQRGDTTAALSTGFADLDALLGGLHPGQLVVVAGRPGSGKSTFGMDVARHVALTGGHTTAVFSLEMERSELMMRMLAAEASVPLQAMRTRGGPPLTDAHLQRLGAAAPRLDTKALFIDDSPTISPVTIRAKSRRLKHRHDLKLVIVDYLQLLNSHRRTETRQQEVSEMSRGLKLVAKELGVPIVALSQLNRNPEQRVDKKPQLSDLRESGSIEQDADVAILVYREDMYTPETRPGEADLIVAKHRNGPLGTCTLAFQGHYSRFANMGTFNS